MVAQYLSNFPTSSFAIQAQVLFHWLVFSNEFDEIETSGSAWNTIDYSASDGIINSLTPQKFYTASNTFDASFLNKHIAIKDSSNPVNSFVAEITAVNSPTEITLDASTVFSVDSASVEFIVFDTASPPSTGDYFVIGNPSSTGIIWQAYCEVDAGSSSLLWQFGFIGGWDTGTSSWTLPVSSDHFMDDAMTQTFCIADSSAGYVYIWSEETGGVGSNRNALWMGSLSPYHSPADLGVPKDTSYSAIFGSPTSGVAHNLSRDTAVTNDVAVGECLDPDLNVIPIYITQKRSLATGNDIMANASASTDPFSLEIDVYSAVVFMRSPDQAWRGTIPGFRIVNDNISNRANVNSNLTYILGDGIAAIWNGKAMLP